MKTRVGVTTLVLLGAVLAGALAAAAEPVRTPRIGVLLYAAAPNPGQPSPLVDAFINLRTSKTLNLTLPSTLIARADHLIE